MAQNTIYNSPSCRIESKCDSLILYIKQNNKEAFIFENILDECLKTKPQEKLDKLIKKQGDKYYICKPLSVKYDNINTNTESKESQNDTKTSDCNKESNRNNIYIKDEISFKNCVFCSEVHFKYITFALLDSVSHDKCNTESNKNPQALHIDFQHCEFRERVYFTNCEFNGNVFFNHAVFHKYADFHESIFNGIVSFYNATFNSAPNFSTCVFSKIQGTDFINVKIESLDFDKVWKFIDEFANDETYKKEKAQAIDSKEIEQITKKHKLRYASNARDSFRTIKNVLIENNNLLDASNWHKLELYAKEIELRLPKPHSKENPNNERKNYIDLIQLCFYRHTSEHHTDLLESIQSLCIVIGIFGILSFVVILGFALYGEFWDWNPNTLVKHYNEYIKCFLAEHYFIALFINFILFVAFIGIFIFSIVCQKMRKIVFVLSCIVAFTLIVLSPKYLIPPIEIFTNKRMLLDPLSVVGGVYSILFGFMLYSFIKTARKNSIIPS
ncbi:pentapeptide repeat-containing protein [Helicobacter sp. 23-1048]